MDWVIVGTRELDSLVEDLEERRGYQNVSV